MGTGFLELEEEFVVGGLRAPDQVPGLFDEVP